MASNLIAVASNLIAVASTLIAMASSTLVEYIPLAKSVSPEQFLGTFDREAELLCVVFALVVGFLGRGTLMGQDNMEMT